MSTTYTATVAREGRWWMIAVPDVDGITQARRLTDVPAMARELIAVSLDIPADDVDVTIVHRPVDGIDVDGAARQRAADLEHATSKRAQALARDLAAHDIPLRDVGAILGVSHQRAHQLVAG